MNELDLFLGIVMLGVVVLEGFRGFGRAAFDGLALYAALRIDSVVYAPLSASVHLAQQADLNQGIVFGLCFAALGAIALVASHFLYGAILLNLGVFEQLMGVGVGIAVALVVAHGIVRTIDLSHAAAPDESPVASSSIGSEALNFSGYHAIMDSLSSSTESHRTIAAN